MQPCLLLTGKPRAGKSTAMKRIIQRVGPEYFGGFYTEEIRDASKRIGFNCISLDGETVCMAHVDNESTVRVGRYGVDVEAFENLALKAIDNSIRTKKITVIDEIGFKQILSAPFENVVHEIRMYHLTEENREEIIERASDDILRFLLEGRK